LVVIAQRLLEFCGGGLREERFVGRQSRLDEDKGSHRATRWDSPVSVAASAIGRHPGAMVKMRRLRANAARSRAQKAQESKNGEKQAQPANHFRQSSLTIEQV
jgi:hypothetical protein